MSNPFSFRLSHSLLLSALALCPASILANDNSVELSPVAIDAKPATPNGSLSQVTRDDKTIAVTVMDEQQLADYQIRAVKDLTKADASLQSSYAPVGYYQSVAVRGFTLDWAKNYRLNNVTIAGEQLFAPENKAQVQILKGLAGIDAGVIAPGGLINYVTKRPDDVRQISLGVDERGSHYQALDAGKWLTPDFGVRVNVARNDEVSYVDHADGRRFFYSLAADWWINERSLILLDTDYQTSSQRSVSGYQLLGGTELPHNVKRSRSLGYQPWQQPVEMKSSNTSLRWQYEVNDSWQFELAGGHSQSVIDDATAFAYGCFGSPDCLSNGGASSDRFFSPNGDYDIYDFRTPDDTRVNDEIRLQFTGDINIAGQRHEPQIGVEWSQRLMSGREWVYEWVGSSNISQNPPVFAQSPNLPGDKVRLLTHREKAAFLQDRWHLTDQWQLLVGARWVKLHEKMYGYDRARYYNKKQTHALPQAALVWQPTANLNTYLSYSKGLSLGEQAPFWTDNEGEILSTRKNQQWELGLSQHLTDKLVFEAALYHLVQPNQYAMPDASASGFTFVAKGDQVHNGIELTLTGAVTEALNLQASLNLVRARLHNSGTSRYENSQLINVPTAKANINADYQLPFISNVYLLGGWHYASRNAATPEGDTKAPAYHVFDAGVRYEHTLGSQQLSWRLQVENLFDRFYWSDTGGYLGDNYLFYGAPRTARLSLNWAF